MPSNPFSDLETFELMRRAALDGAETFENHVRRQAAAARREAAGAVELRLSSRVERMVEVAIASSRAVLLVGPPGTGKTEILEQVIGKINRAPAHFGFSDGGVDANWLTPEEEWSFENLVLGQTVVDNEIVSTEGELLKAIRNDQWLVLDEANRADLDRVLGGVLTWLSEKRVKIGSTRLADGSEIPTFLGWSEDRKCTVEETHSPPSRDYLAGSDWRFLGTYNAVDAQRVFRMGDALSRRFKHVPIPPASLPDFRLIISARVEDDSLREWIVERLSLIYEGHLSDRDTQFGAGLFVDIPAYIETGLRMAARSASGDSIVGAEDSQNLIAGAVAGTEISTSVSADGTDRHILLEELLVEGYLVSLGSFVAKFDDDLVEILRSSLIDRGAFTVESWGWLERSLPAMRA